MMRRIHNGDLKSNIHDKALFDAVDAKAPVSVQAEEGDNCSSSPDTEGTSRLRRPCRLWHLACRPTWWPSGQPNPKDGWPSDVIEQDLLKLTVERKATEQRLRDAWLAARG